jgi:hypothetical protein
MTPEQIAKLLELLSRIADSLASPRPYTLTGASDWPILLVLGGILAIMIGLIGALIRLMWSDLRTSMRDNRSEWREAVAEVKGEERVEHDLLWAALRDCQGECCPPRIGHTETSHKRRVPRETGRETEG